MHQNSVAQPSRNREVNMQAGAAGGDSVMGLPPRRPLSLLDLPDELLACILKLHYRHVPGSLRDASLSRVSSTLISKRLCRISLPIFRSDIRMCTGPWMDNFLADTADFSQTIKQQILHLSTEIPAEVPSLTFAAISSLSGLTSLTIDITDASASGARHLDKMLQRLPHLSRLVVEGCFEADHRHLIDFRNSAPALRFIQLYSDDLIRNFFDGDVSHVSHIRLMTEEPGKSEVPWHQVQDLSIEPLHSFENEEDLLIQMEAQALQQLDLADVENLEWIPESLQLSSIQTLTLQATMIDDKTAPAIPFSLAFPGGHAAISYFRTTTLLTFCCTTPDNGRDIRWTRQSRDDDFESECWTLE
ncbi:hypothetical protein JCM11641_001941 [Rhodosporidiobolus odoratus]